MNTKILFFLPAALLAVQACGESGTEFQQWKSETAVQLRNVLPGKIATPIPDTLYPVPAKRNRNAGKIKKAAKYLKYTPEQWAALVPEQSPAPMTDECQPFSSSYNTDNSPCYVCGGTGGNYGFFKYDILNEPEIIRCAATGKSLFDFKLKGSDLFHDYRGKTYSRAYFLSPFLKSSITKGPAKIYVENVRNRARIQAICGNWNGGILTELAEAYYESGDERFSICVIAILERLAQVFPSYPWMGHTSMVPLPKQELLNAAKRHSVPYHSWLGPARLAAGEANFRTPMESVYFDNMIRAYFMVEPAKAWGDGAVGFQRKNFVKKNLFEEGSLLFSAYGAAQVMGNGIGMYAPGLYSTAVILKSDYFYSGFMKIIEEFLYNENYYDGFTVEGSANYAGMVGGMYGLFKKCGLNANQEYMQKNSFLNIAGRTRERVMTLRGLMSQHGDGPNVAYGLAPLRKDVGGQPILLPSENMGGFGMSILRSGSAAKRMELFFSHDRVTGHAHDDMLGIQLYYNGVPLLEHFGDSRSGRFLDVSDQTEQGKKLRALPYPAPILEKDPRPRGFGLPDINTSLTKHTVTVDEYLENKDEVYSRGAFGRPKFAWGNLNAFSAGVPNGKMQFAEAEGVDMNSYGQNLRMFRRALMTIEAPDGTPYLADFFTVGRGHRHLFLLHSRGREVASSLPKGSVYPHLNDLFGRNDYSSYFKMPAADILHVKEVLNEVQGGSVVYSSWMHSWLLDYTQWAPKTRSTADSCKVPPILLTVNGFFSGRAFAVRGKGHFPGTISETIDGKNLTGTVQFRNAVNYAGIFKEKRDSLYETYIQIYTVAENQKMPDSRKIRRLKPDHKASHDENALEITFPDGVRDILFHTPSTSSGMISWEKKEFVTDARFAMIRISPEGKILHSELAGGTKLVWKQKEVLQQKTGLLKGEILYLEGDITGNRKVSNLILRPFGDWPSGTVLQGKTIIVGFNRGVRRESYRIDSVQKQNNGTLTIRLTGSPFFVDYFGTVTAVAKGEAMRDIMRKNEFCGTDTNKGGSGETEYLTGSKVAFPEQGLVFTLKGRETRNRYDLMENVDLQKAGIHPGSPFCIYPDWEKAIAEVMFHL